MTSVSRAREVCNSRLDEALSPLTAGWLIHPDRPGRLVAFDGSLLHGVIPPLAEFAPDDDGPARITLMTGWWALDTAEPTPRHQTPGPNRALSPAAAKLLPMAPPSMPPRPPSTPAHALYVPSVWQSLPRSRSSKRSKRLEGGFMATAGFILTSPTAVRDEILTAARRGVVGQLIAALDGPIGPDELAQLAQVALEHPDEAGLALHPRVVPALLAPDQPLKYALTVAWACARHAWDARVARFALASSTDHVPQRALALCWCLGEGMDARIEAWFAESKGLDALVLLAGEDCILEGLTELAAKAPSALARQVLKCFEDDGES